MTLYVAPAYGYVLIDEPGVILANNFVSFFNPVDSGVIAEFVSVNVASYAVHAVSVASSLYSMRITDASAGTLIDPATIPKAVTFFPDSKLEIRVDGPTVTTSGLTLTVFPPVIAVVTGQNSNSVGPIPNVSLACMPGEGVVFATDSGSADQIWNIAVYWEEKKL